MKKPKQPPCPHEFDEQVAVINWAREYAKNTNDYRLELLHGDSSGVRVPIGCAVKMKKAGAIKGWPDLFLPVNKCHGSPNLRFVDYSGLFIELKRKRGGVVSDEQEYIHTLLKRQGYSVEVCRGADEAIRVIKEYLWLED